MTPQMQLSLKLLQMNSLELDDLVQQEVLENPFLEMEEESSDTSAEELEAQETDVIHTLDSDSDSLGDNFSSSDETPTIPTGEVGQEGEETADNQVNLSSDVEPSPIDERPEQFTEMDVNWNEVFDDNEPHTYTAYNPDADDRGMEETVAGRTSLYEMLDRQLRLSSLEGEDAEIGRYLIGCIDDRGYLQMSVEDCAQNLDVEPAQVESVLEVIQKFDPTGVGARNLPECLSLQLEARGKMTPLAQEILNNYWGDFLKKKFKEIARAAKTDEKSVIEVFNQIRRLDPSPGGAYTKAQPQYIIPDVYIRKIDGAYITYLNERQVAHLRLSNVYKEILLKGNGAEQDPQTREYALEKYRSAVMFIKNIEKRRSTVLRVTECIMEYQREFLERGVEALRPLALSEIASQVGMHESTISRVTSGKYVDTPQGLYELKFFFSSGIESSSGEAASSRSIKQKIMEMVGREDPRRPLSDDRITQKLKAEGFTIARRTVAKYREQLKILPTSLRKKND